MLKNSLKCSKTACAVLSCLLVTACASPTVMEKQKVDDHQLSCAVIEAEIRETERFRRAAEDEKGFTATNTAAVLLFWPAMIATYSNVSDATKAADERKANLMNLYRNKQCGGRLAEADITSKIG